MELQNASTGHEEEPSEVEKREAEEKERKKRKEHMKIIKQVETGGEIKPATAKPEPSNPPVEPIPQVESPNSPGQGGEKARDETKNDMQLSGEDKSVPQVPPMEEPKKKEKKRSLTKEAAENIINAFKGSPEKDLRKELKKANSKDKDLQYEDLTHGLIIDSYLI